MKTIRTLFESDGGIQSVASGGVIGGRVFGANTPINIEQSYKTLYKDIKQSIGDSKKLGFARNKKKVDGLIETANTLLRRELEVMGKGHSDNAYSALYEGLNDALEKVLVHGDKRDIVRNTKVRKVQDELFENVFWRSYN